jgi:mRNA-degrading endonuclease toxin of MazEF toxin-antitoxin module
MGRGSSNKADCRDANHPTVTVVVCSAKVEYSGQHDVLLRAPDGGLERDSIAQTDLVFVVLKDELTDERFHGILMADTLLQIRAKLSETLGFPGPSSA